MSAIEDSLRRALANGDARDPAFRESIYAASERALEKMLDTRSLEPAAADEQRRRLVETIALVEAEHADAHRAASQTAAEPEPDPVRAPASYAAPAEATTDESEASWSPPQRGPAERRRRFRPGIAFAVFALIALAAIVVYIGSIIFAPTGEDVTLQEPGTTTEGETAAGTSPPAEAPTQTADAPPDLNWISVFSGAELEALTAPPGGRVEAVDADGQSLVRISSTNGVAQEADPAEGESGEIAVAIGPGIVREIVGSPVRVEIRAGSPDGSLREFSVRCRFGEASVCERQRFATMMSEEAFVFDVDVPAGAIGPASLAIAPGLGAEGSDVDLYAVRIRVL